MAEEKDWEEEQDGCAECGEVEYAPSKVPGLCLDCYSRHHQNLLHYTYQ